MPDILRYPYEAITEKTDYLQLTIFKYDTAGYGTGELTANKNFVNQNPHSALSIASGVAKNKVLSDGGVIALPMPSNIEDTNSVSYETGEMNELAAAGIRGYETATTPSIVTQAGKDGKPGPIDVTASISKGAANIYEGAANFIKTAGNKDLILKALSAQAVNIFGANVSVNQLLARTGGKVLNPNMELLFGGPTLRTFRFSFKMTPRDENESVSIKSIIRTLKKNMAAKGVGDLFLQTPNIFELQYKKGNKPHPYLNLFKPCALTDISVNYTGENVYATYADGTPISMVMTLTFKELVPIYAEDYDDSVFDSTEAAGDTAASAYDQTYKSNPSLLEERLVYGATKRRENTLGIQNDVEGVGY